MSDVLESPVREEIDQSDDDLAHIVRPAKAVEEAYRNGTEVTALCGFKFVPTKDPYRRKICDICKLAAANSSGSHNN